MTKGQKEQKGPRTKRINRTKIGEGLALIFWNFFIFILFYFYFYFHWYLLLYSNISIIRVLFVYFILLSTYFIAVSWVFFTLEKPTVAS